jgi:hypothetical protein
MWNQKLNDVMINMKFKRAKSDTCLYVSENNKLFVIVYVDDIIIIGKELMEIENLKKGLSENFQMKDLGEIKTFVGLEIERDIQHGTISISQKQYIEKLLYRFGMQDCKPVKTPMVEGSVIGNESKKVTDLPFRELIGALQYLAIMSRPDIAVSVNMLSKYQNSPTDENYSGLKRILRYLRGTTDVKLKFSKNKDELETLIGYADADFANDIVDRKSISGYVFKLYGNTISWSTKKQPTISLSSTEAELIALCHATKEAVWIKNLLKEIDVNLKSILIMEDNIPCIKIAEEPKEHQRLKHLDIKYLFVRDLIQQGIIKLKYIGSKEQPADMMTKPLGRLLLEKHCKFIGLN